MLEGFDVPEGMLVAGIPAKVKRALTEEEKQMIRQSAVNYVRLSSSIRSRTIEERCYETHILGRSWFNSDSRQTNGSLWWKHTMLGTSP